MLALTTIRNVLRSHVISVTNVDVCALKAVIVVHGYSLTLYFSTLVSSVFIFLTVPENGQAQDVKRSLSSMVLAMKNITHTTTAYRVLVSRIGWVRCPLIQINY